MITELAKLAIFLAPLLIEWLLKVKAEKPNAYQTKITAFNRSLVNRNAVDISLAFNRMRVPEKPGHRNGGDPSGPGSPDPSGRQL